MPSVFHHEKVTEMLAAKVFTAYRQRGDVTPAGKHAVDQLLLRLRYLSFDGSAADLAVRSGSSTMASDFVLEEDLLKSLSCIYVSPQKSGAFPDRSIFNRSLFRRRSISIQKLLDQSSPREDPGPLDSFPNALQAAQELSYASTKVRHIDAIDDILIANNIVHSANGDKVESYNYIWSWQDADQTTQGIEEKRSSESFLSFASPVKGRGSLPGALSLLDSLCGVVGAGP